MRHVVHLAVDPKRSSVGLSREGRHHTTRMRQIRFRRGEECIDRRYLIGVNGDPSHKDIAARDPPALRQPALIPESRISRTHRLNARVTRCKQALLARYLILD